MDDRGLAKLVTVSVREARKHEAHHFTPWLAENLDRLSEELGIELELEGTEVQVGSYRADIVARNPRDGARVLIENQLEDADIHHLGQVMAYLTGLEAKIVVWIARHFDDTHLSALRWLNEHTSDPFSFFAVQLSVVRIGDSPLAPVFNVLERPNDWNRRVQGVQELSELSTFRREFWTYFAQRKPHTPGLRPRFAGANPRHPVDEVSLTVVLGLFRGSQGSVGVWAGAKWGEDEEDRKRRVEPYLEELGRVNQRLCSENDHVREIQPHEIRLMIDTTNRSNWDEMVDWLDATRRAYERVLRTPISPERSKEPESGAAN